MALTKVGGDIIRQPLDIGSLNATTLQIGAATTISTTGIDVGPSGIITASSFVGPVTGNASSATVATNAQGLTGSPSISVTNITASGNVSIAGTLTYEDVTNVDSVGLITAREGIRIGVGTVGIVTAHLGLQVTGGSLGIGTNPGVGYNSLTNGLVVSRGGENEGITIDCSNQGGLFFSNGTGGGEFKGQLIYYHTPGNHSMRMLVDGGERLRITGIGSLGVGTQTPKTDLDISQKTGAVALPQGTTAQRPSGSAPYIRKNTTNNALEYFDGTSWVEIITDYFPTGSTILG